MRNTILALAALALTACGGFESTPKAVDPATLPPMSSQEQALLTTGDVAARQGNYVQAEKSYTEAVALSKGHVTAHLALADMYVKSNQTRKARAILERAAQYQPNHPDVNYKLGKIYLQEDKAEEALAAFNRGLSTQPLNLDLLIGKGIAHDMLRQHTAAQVAYQRAINTNPGQAALVRTNLAMSYLLDNKPDKAAELLKKDAREKNASAVTRHNLALAYGMLGRHTEARALVKGELSEEERQSSLKRLAQYIAQRDDSGKAIKAPVTPALIKEGK